MYTSLTAKQKLYALSGKYYNNIGWLPKKGDYYTSSRHDLELYRVVDVTDDKIYTQYCSNVGNTAEWDINGFTTEGFGVYRVFVPNWILDLDNKWDAASILVEIRNKLNLTATNNAMLDLRQWLDN